MTSIDEKTKRLEFENSRLIEENEYFKSEEGRANSYGFGNFVLGLIFGAVLTYCVLTKACSYHKDAFNKHYNNNKAQTEQASRKY